MGKPALEGESWEDLHEHRDQAMLGAIQRYSEEHAVDLGVFLLGAAHRRSIMEKAESVQTNAASPLAWIFDRYDGVIDG